MWLFSLLLTIDRKYNLLDSCRGISIGIGDFMSTTDTIPPKSKKVYFLGEDIYWRPNENILELGLDYKKKRDKAMSYFTIILKKENEGFVQLKGKEKTAILELCNISN